MKFWISCLFCFVSFLVFGASTFFGILFWHVLIGIIGIFYPTGKVGYSFLERVILGFRQHCLSSLQMDYQAHKGFSHYSRQRELGYVERYCIY